MPLLNLRGHKFGHLSVVDRAPLRRSPITGRTGNAIWICRCECGNVREVRSNDLRQGHTRSCGCHKSDNARAHNTKHGGAPSRRPTQLYRAWQDMKTRCTNPKYNEFHRYGGRGIRVCDEWMHDFAAFAAHVGPRPTSQQSLDRFPNNDGNYEPGNVRWATRSEQRANRSS